MFAYCSPIVSDAQLNSSVERPCPAETVEFTCTLSSTSHDWNIPSLSISRALAPVQLGIVFSNPPFEFSVTEVMQGTSILTSTATVNTTQDLNVTLILCRDGLGMLPDQNTTINLRGEHEVIVCAFYKIT